MGENTHSEIASLAEAGSAGSLNGRSPEAKISRAEGSNGRSAHTAAGTPRRRASARAPQREPKLLERALSPASGGYEPASAAVKGERPQALCSRGSEVEGT
jgi:hypothetical protein